jgi:hypothetical protein
MRTADGVEITDGLRVFNNDLNTGTIDLVYGGGPKPETNHNTGHVEWWFYMRLDKEAGRYCHLTSESRVTTTWKGQKA